jgi:hypothetical protein
MARFIPVRPLDFNDSVGEQEVFESLARLPDGYVVFHSLRWVAQPGLRYRRPFGEADFVLFVPARGLLVIEVKSGLIRFSGRQWFQRNRQTKEELEIEDPEKQASRTAFYLKDLLKERLERDELCRVFPVVWFPSEPFPRSSLPPNYLSQMIFDRETLQNPEPAIKAAFDFWEAACGRSVLSSNAEKSVIHTLAPELGAAVSLRWALDSREQEFLRLTRKQNVILDFLEEQERATVQGGAGTGKTFVAIEKARRLSGRSGSTLFLCYNTALRNFLERHHPIPRVDFHTFHSLAASLLRPAPPLDEIEDSVLELLTDPSFRLPYEHILIDEGQDFRDEWIDSLAELTNGHFYIFYDRNQLVQRAVFPAWIVNSECRLTLSQNCRNTAEVARTSQRAIMGRVIGEHQMPSGPIPTFHSCESDEAACERARTILTNWIEPGCYAPHDVAILTLNTLDTSSFGRIEKFGPWRLAEEIAPGFVCRNTVRRFKGLEARAVLLVDCELDDFADPTKRNLFYVGGSRAMHELAVLFGKVNHDNISNALDGLAPGRRIPKTPGSFARFLGAQWQEGSGK